MKVESLSAANRKRLMKALDGIGPERRAEVFKVEDRALLRALCGDPLRVSTNVVILDGIRLIETGSA